MISTAHFPWSYFDPCCSLLLNCFCPSFLNAIYLQSLLLKSCSTVNFKLNDSSSVMLSLGPPVSINHLRSFGSSSRHCHFKTAFFCLDLFYMIMHKTIAKLIGHLLHVRPYPVCFIRGSLNLIAVPWDCCACYPHFMDGQTETREYWGHSLVSDAVGIFSLAFFFSLDPLYLTIGQIVSLNLY